MMYDKAIIYQLRNHSKITIMKRILFAFLAAGILLSACGTSKKLDTANAQISLLNSQVSQLNSQLTEKEKLNAELQKANEINSRDAADCRAAKESLRQKKDKLDKELAARGTSLEEIEARASKAVSALRAAGCDVKYENGRYHITVPDAFVFALNSTAIRPRGREALNVIAQVMYDNPGVTTTIVGNTDTLSIRGKADNWSLSTERANAVVRVLEDLYNINPRRLVAAGRSKFNPIASNETEEGRARNRRIEIIINPHYDRLFDLMAD
jgi:chemotaxis protein MotB